MQRIDASNLEAHRSPGALGSTTASLDQGRHERTHFSKGKKMSSHQKIDRMAGLREVFIAGEVLHEERSPWAAVFDELFVRT